jgi:GT2 family glycosyltransferase
MTMATPSDVTVVICSRDRPSMLANALAAVSAATPAEVQVLVVDSASSSAQTRDVAVSAGVDYLRTDVKGLSIARNIGYAAGREIIVFTDDDCEPVAGWIDQLLKPFADARVGAVTGLLLDSSRMDELNGSQAQLAPAMKYSSVRRGLDAGHGALMAFRRDLLAQLDGFDDVLGAGRYFAGAEDLDMFCRVLAFGRTIVHQPRAIVCHMNTRDEVAYRALLGGYGRGLGAMIAKWWRIAPGTAMQLATIVYLRACLRLLRGIRSSRKRGGELAFLRGVSVGLASARGMTVVGSRFADANRPQEAPLETERPEAEAAQ